jgi:hypothetical protein
VKNQHGQKEIEVIYFILITAHPTGQNKKMLSGSAGLRFNSSWVRQFVSSDDVTRR